MQVVPAEGHPRRRRITPDSSLQFIRSHRILCTCGYPATSNPGCAGWHSPARWWCLRGRAKAARPQPSDVFAQLRSRERRAGRTGSLFFWRDRAREVDFVVDVGGHLELFEAKWTELPNAGDTVNLDFVARQKEGLAYCPVRWFAARPTAFPSLMASGRFRCLRSHKGANEVRPGDVARPSWPCPGMGRMPMARL
jgi:hypothetical protein